MRSVCVLIAAIALFATAAAAETLFNKRAGMSSVKAYQSFLNDVRGKLLGGDDDALELVEDTLDAVKDDGDAYFPLVLLGDLMAAPGADDDLQEDAIEMILELAGGKGPVSHREIAIEQLSRVVAAPDLADMDWAADAAKSLTAHAEGDDLVLMHAALAALGRLSIRSGGDWEDLAEDAAKAIAERLDDDDPEVRRIALSVAIKALTLAKESTDATEVLWDQLEEAIGDIESPSLQEEARARVTALMAVHQSGIFKDEVDSVREELKVLKSTRKASSDNLESSLKNLRGETDAADIDAYLAKIERSVKDAPAMRVAAMSTLAAIAADPAIAAYKLHYITDSLFTIAMEARSLLTYHRATSIYLELINAHRASGRASVPLAALPRLLAAADQPALLAPALQEARALAAGNLPFWIRRRLVASVFLQAGDATDESARKFAFQQLSELGGTGAPWPVRYEALTRIQQLANLAKHADVKGAAAAWN